MDRALFARILLALLVSLASSTGCNLPQDEQPVTEAWSTTAVPRTIPARFTETVAFTHTSFPRPTATGSISATQTPSSIPATFTPRSPTLTPVPTIPCNLAAAGNPIDVTIRDDAQMQPGEAFTKIWRLQNVGSCTWTKDYRAELFSGEAMGETVNVRLPEEVKPGEKVLIAVDMVSPEAPGTYQSNWKLRNKANNWFGIGPNGNSPFWVRIVVVHPPTETITPAPPSPTPTIEPPTPTITPTFTVTPVTPTVTPTITSTSTLTPPAPSPTDTLTLLPRECIDPSLDPVNFNCAVKISSMSHFRLDFVGPKGKEQWEFYFSSPLQLVTWKILVLGRYVS